MNRSAWILALALMVMVPPAMAQVSDTTALTYEVLTQEYDSLVKDAMALTDEEWVAFEPVFDAYKAEMEPVHKREVNMIRSYIKTHKNMTDEAAEAMLVSYREIQKDEWLVTKEYQKKFQKVIPATKVLRFFQIDNRLNMVLMEKVVRDIPLAG